MASHLKEDDVWEVQSQHVEAEKKWIKKYPKLNDRFLFVSIAIQNYKNLINEAAVKKEPEEKLSHLRRKLLCLEDIMMVWEMNLHAAIKKAKEAQANHVKEQYEAKAEKQVTSEFNQLLESEQLLDIVKAWEKTLHSETMKRTKEPQGNHVKEKNQAKAEEQATSESATANIESVMDKEGASARDAITAAELFASTKAHRSSYDRSPTFDEYLKNLWFHGSQKKISFRAPSAPNQCQLMEEKPMMEDDKNTAGNKGLMDSNRDSDKKTEEKTSNGTPGLDVDVMKRQMESMMFKESEQDLMIKVLTQTRETMTSMKTLQSTLIEIEQRKQIAFLLDNQYGTKEQHESINHLTEKIREMGLQAHQKSENCMKQIVELSMEVTEINILLDCMKASADLALMRMDPSRMRPLGVETESDPEEMDVNC